MDELEAIRRAAELRRIYFTHHAQAAMRERGRPWRALKGALLSGAIRLIEVQADDPRGVVYLVQCRTNLGPARMAFMIDEHDRVVLVTVYVP